MRDLINIILTDGEVHFMFVLGAVVIGCCIYSKCIYHGDDL